MLPTRGGSPSTAPSGCAGSTKRTQRRNSMTSAMSSSSVSRTMIFSPPMRKSVVSGVVSIHPMWSGLIATTWLFNLVSLITKPSLGRHVRPLRAPSVEGRSSNGRAKSVAADLARTVMGERPERLDLPMRILGTVERLSAGLDYHLARHNLLTANLAHADTPG